MTTVLVTGGGGFIGSAIVRCLSVAGHQVVVPHRSTEVPVRLTDEASGIRFVPGVTVEDVDGLDRLFRQARPTWVVHAAAAGVRPGTADSATMAAVNVGGLVNVIEAAMRHQSGRMVVIGSGFEYRPSDSPLDEEAPIGPTTLYGATKAAASLIAAHYRETAGADVTIVRPFSVYGPREAISRFVPHVVTQALDDEAIRMSSGTQLRDYVFVEDVAEAIRRLLLLVDRPPAVLNVVGPERHSLRDVAESVAELADSRSTLHFGAREPNPGDRSSFIGNGDKLHEILGWHPAHGLRAGLTETIDWYERHRGTWNAL